MNPDDQNLVVLGFLTVLAAFVALLVGALASDTLRHEGIRGVVRRWLRR